VLAGLLVVAAVVFPRSETAALLEFAAIVAFLWIPAACILSARSSEDPGWVADAGALALDLVLLLAAQIVLGPAAIAVLAGLVVPVAIATYVRGLWLGAVGAVVGVAAVTGITAVRGGIAEELDPFAIVVYPVLLGVVAWLLDAVATDRWRADAGLERLDERSDAILTRVGEAVVVTGPDGRVEHWNRAAAATFDRQPQHACGRRCGDVVGLEHEGTPIDCTNGCGLLALSDGVDVEVSRRLPTGARQPLLASASAVVDMDGTVIEVVHSFRDITRLKQAEEAKSLFLATASHELKTPVTVIQGFSQMLQLPEAILGEDERKAALRTIEQRAAQLTSIIDRLLLSSRIDAGHVDLDLIDVDLLPLVRERADTTEMATEREIDLDLPERLPAAWCDRNAFITVLDHLLDNAVKYSPAGEPVVIEARVHETTIDLVVTDQGIGMTAAEAAHCFDRFWQAEDTDVRRFGGTGIGLYIARSLAMAMGGEIAVRTAPGVGSSFAIRLERADHHLAMEEQARDSVGLGRHFHHLTQARRA
jgi:PAS domain S-box-containing protein